MGMRACLLCGRTNRAGLIVREQMICGRCLERMLRREGAALSDKRRRRLIRLYG